MSYMSYMFYKSYMSYNPSNQIKSNDNEKDIII